MPPVFLPLCLGRTPRVSPHWLRSPSHPRSRRSWPDWRAPRITAVVVRGDRLSYLFVVAQVALTSEGDLSGTSARLADSICVALLPSSFSTDSSKFDVWFRLLPPRRVDVSRVRRSQTPLRRAAPPRPTSPLLSSPPSTMTGFPSVPRHRLVSLLGEGGVGRVCLAEDVVLPAGGNSTHDRGL